MKRAFKLEVQTTFILATWKGVGVGVRKVIAHHSLRARIEIHIICGSEKRAFIYTFSFSTSFLSLYVSCSSSSTLCSKHIIARQKSDPNQFAKGAYGMENPSIK